MKCLLNQNKGDSVFNIWRLSNHLQYNYPTDIKVAFGTCFFYNKFSESHSCILTKENWERQSRLKLLLDAWWTSLRKAHLMLSCFFKAIMQKTTHLWNIISQYLKRTFFFSKTNIQNKVPISAWDLDTNTMTQESHCTLSNKKCNI